MPFSPEWECERPAGGQNEVIVPVLPKAKNLDFGTNRPDFLGNGRFLNKVKILLQKVREYVNLLGIM